jgi:hypothetical protein
VHTGYWWETLRESEHLHDLNVDGRTILKLVFSKWDGGMDWIDLAQDRDRWREFAHAVTVIYVSVKVHADL